MRLADLRYIPQIRTSAVSSFRGINKCEYIADDEFVEARGVSLRNYPAICSRNEEGLQFELAQLNEKTPCMKAFFCRNNSIYVLISYIKNKNDYNPPNAILCCEIALAKGQYISGSSGRYKVDLAGNWGRMFTVIMGSYICIFPNCEIFNIRTNELQKMYKSIQTTNVVFEPAFQGSVFTKIYLPNVDKVFNKFDAVTISGCINNDFNTTKIITEIGVDYIVVAGKINQRFENTQRLFVERKVPMISWSCEAKNRLWACSHDGKEIYSSRLGDPFNFNSFEGIATDSYAVSVGSEGLFTACTSYLGHVYFFKENTIHKVFGDKPSNFQIVDYEAKGVKSGCEDSICIIDDIMYYAGIDGIYAYDGTIPVNISKQLGDINPELVCGGELEGNYIFSTTYIINNGNNRKTIITDIYIYYPKYKAFVLYKTETSTLNADLYLYDWLALYDSKYRFTKYKDKLLCWNYKSISYIHDQSSFFESSHNDNRQSCLVSKYMEEGSIMHKYIIKLLFDIELGQNSTVVISLQYDDDKLWTEAFSTTSETHKTISVPILPRRCKKFRYKIDAIKDFTLRGVVKFIEEGSEVNGFI